MSLARDLKRLRLEERARRMEAVIGRLRPIDGFREELADIDRQPGARREPGPSRSP